MEITAEYKAVFAEEAHEHLQEWETALLEVEHRPGDPELVNRMFRAIHTLKGSAGFIGFEKLQQVVHDLESSLQDIRDGKAALELRKLELLFKGLDLCRRMVESFISGQPFEEDVEAFRREIDASREKVSPAPHPAPTGREPAVPCTAPSGGRRFQVGLLVQASGREAYLRSFLVRNRLTGLATILREDPPPEVLKDSGGRFAYSLTLETNRDEASLREALNVDLLAITSFDELKPEAELKSSGRKTETVEVRSEEVVRVSVERLDLLLNLVGELVIQNSGFRAIAEQFRGRYGHTPQLQELEEKTAGLAKITRDLQDGIMKVRMLPVNNVFSRFHRVVRDLAKDRGKQIRLELFGEETEIDKKVMDRIGDPLVHLVRNAVDHGIERQEQRRSAGKPAAGTIRLGAYQDGDHICIEVSDDGGGLDRAAVLAKAIEKKLVCPEEVSRLTDEKVFDLIFVPGFSTAEKVTEVSGRGVGMDVVKRAVEALDGSVRVRSIPGRGTTVTIRLPLTMAIIPALLVEVSESILAIPLSSVKEVLKVSEDERRTVGGREVIRLREKVLALVQLREALGLPASPTPNGSRQPVVIVDYEEKSIGLLLERVLGNREIVIKSLSRHYREIEGLIGASILGDGRIALIVDVEALVRRCYLVVGKAPEVVGAQPAAPPAEKGAEAPTPPTASSEPVAPSVKEDLTAEMRALSGGAMEEIQNEGAIQASLALSRMSGREIRVSFPESQLLPIGGLAAQLGGEESTVCGIYVGLAGELTGSILMVLPESNLLLFHELLHQLPPGSCQAGSEVDLSALSELGNVLSASFINALADGARLKIRSEAPELSIDMCQAVIDSVLARCNRPGEKLLFTRALLYLGDSQQVACHLLLFLEPSSLARLLQLLSADQTAEGRACGG